MEASAFKNIAKWFLILLFLVTCLYLGMAYLLKGSHLVSENPSEAGEDAKSGTLLVNLDDLKKGNDLRKVCRKKKEYNECIDELDTLAKSSPENRAIRYNAALAYVDKLPGHSLYKQGWLSTRSMDHMTKIIDKDQDNWLAFYIRGMNNLYWPSWFKRTERAIRDLSRCVEIAEALPAIDIRPYHVLGYVALGDAQVKAGRFQTAREIWEKGQAVYPSRQIAKRVELEEKSLVELVAKIRDLDNPIDTDLAFLWDDKSL